MNILHISSANSWRGGEQQIAYLIEELSLLGHKNYLLHPIGAPIANHNPIKEITTFIPYKKGFSLNPMIASKIGKAARTHKIDIIHAHDSHAHSFLWLSYLLKFNKVPSVVSRRVDFPISKSSINKYNHPSIKRILCVSQKINHIVRQSLGDQDRILTVHSGVDLDKFTNAPVLDLRKKYNLPSDQKLVGNISAIADHKDYITFSKVAQQVIKERTDTTFFIIGGNGGSMKEIESYIADNHLEENIILTGYLDDAYTVVSQLDIFFFPSKAEGLGTSLLDACAAKVPILTTDAGGIPEIIIHNINGLVSKPGDVKGFARQIKSLFGNPELCYKLTREASTIVANFSKTKTAAKTLAQYQSVIEEK